MKKIFYDLVVYCITLYNPPHFLKSPTSFQSMGADPPPFSNPRINTGYVAGFEISCSPIVHTQEKEMIVN